MKTLPTLQQAIAVPNVLQVSYNGTQWTAYEPGDTLPARPTDNGIPQEVSMRQARLALENAGKTAAVQAVINGMAEPAKTQTQIWWEYSGFVQRGQPLVAQLGAAIGLTSAGIDDLFKAAILL